MNIKRKFELTFNPELRMTKEEVEQGYVFCCEWDGLVIGPEDPEYQVCLCKNKDARAYA